MKLAFLATKYSQRLSDTPNNQRNILVSVPKIVYGVNSALLMLQCKSEYKVIMNHISGGEISQHIRRAFPNTQEKVKALEFHNNRHGRNADG